MVILFSLMVSKLLLKKIPWFEYMNLHPGYRIQNSFEFCILL